MLYSARGTGDPGRVASLFRRGKGGSRSTGIAFRLFRSGTVVLLLLLLTGCFDYQERIVFAPDFSGYVDIDYDVPVHLSSGHSMIGFLPLEEERLKSRYTGLFSGRGVEIENYSVEYGKDEREKKNSPFYNRAHVKFRIYFKNPEELEHILLGKTAVFWRNQRLHVQRMFPAAQSLPDTAGAVTRRLGNLISRTLVGKKMSFVIVFPWYYDLFTNQGSFLRPGIQAFTLPLENTVKSGSPTFWNIEIKANSDPREDS